MSNRPSTKYQAQNTKIVFHMIIGISGGTGSGKTTVANRILESVRADEVVFIQQDLYYRDLKDMPLDYRNAANFCTAATVNISNGVRVLWMP